MSTAMDTVRDMRARLIEHLHRGMQFMALGACLTGAIVVASLVGVPLPWWLTATAAASLAVQARSLLKLRLLLVETDVAAVRGWEMPAAYAMGVVGVVGMLWALWQMSTRTGAG